MFVLSLVLDVLAEPLTTLAVLELSMLPTVVALLKGDTNVPAFAFALVPVDFEILRVISESVSPVPPVLEEVFCAVSLHTFWLLLILKFAVLLTVVAPRSGVTDKATFIVGSFPDIVSLDASVSTKEPFTVTLSGAVPVAP